MSKKQIKEQIKFWSNQKDPFANLFFGPNNPEHLELPPIIIMKCIYCDYEEKAKIVEEIIDIEGEEYPKVMYPTCSSKRKTYDLGIMDPKKNIYIFLVINKTKINTTIFLRFQNLKSFFIERFFYF